MRGERTSDDHNREHHQRVDAAARQDAVRQIEHINRNGENQEICKKRKHGNNDDVAANGRQPVSDDISIRISLEPLLERLGSTPAPAPATGLLAATATLPPSTDFSGGASFGEEGSMIGIVGTIIFDSTFISGPTGRSTTGGRIFGALTSNFASGALRAIGSGAFAGSVGHSTRDAGVTSFDGSRVMRVTAGAAVGPVVSQSAAAPGPAGGATGFIGGGCSGGGASFFDFDASLSSN